MEATANLIESVLYFALHSESEHCHLHLKPSQLHLFEPLGERAYHSTVV